MANDSARERVFDVSALFDLTFQRFVTIGIIKIVYLIGLVFIAIGFLFMVISGFTQGTMGVIAALILAPIVCFLWVLFLRIYLELIVVLFRIAENTSIMAGRGTLTATPTHDAEV